MTTGIDSKETLQGLVDISRRAGDAILEWYDGDISVMTKDDDSPLTRADLASHAVISSALKQRWPDVPVLSEESADIPWQTRKQWKTYWLVDTLDGTKEFINRNGEFTVNIALIDEYRPVIGVVHVPVSGTSYFGSVEGGAWRRDGDETAAPIRVRRPVVSTRSTLTTHRIS